MNKKTAIILLLGIIGASNSFAAQVSESRARAIAGEFFNVNMPKKPATIKAHGNNAAYYVFNNPEQPGWVIIAGDDRARQILAYGDEDYFDTADVPDCIQDWLDTYAMQIAGIDGATTHHSANYAPTQSLAASSKSRIAPMLTSNWAQGLPFNQQCATTTEGGSTYCPAGCVAIAMAQILYYYKSGTQCVAIPGYTSQRLNRYMPALPATIFNYSVMNDWYENEVNNSTSAQETAKLVRYCAQSVQMNFGVNSSSATSQRNAFVYYFGFDKDAMQHSRTDYNANDWENMVYTELAGGRPVYISARKESGGHAFICDGYENGLFHINWGWRSHQNGYFALNALSDGNAGGTGAASGEEGYTINVQIMTGLQPSTGSTTGTNGNRVAILNKCEIQSSSYSRSSQSENFTNVQLTAYYWNNSSQTYNYDLGWGLYDSNGNLITTHTVLTGKTLQPTYYTYPSASISLGKNLSAGTYYLKPICRISGSSTYYLCRGAGVNYIKAVITTTNLNLTVYDDLSVQDLRINSVSASSIKKVGSPLTLTLNVSNMGLTDYNYVYMWANNKRVSGTTTDLPIGSTGNMIMTYIPSEAGTLNLKFTADSLGTKSLKTFSTTINSATAASITGTTQSSVSGTTFNASTNITNTNTNAYNDYIVAKLYKKDPNSGNTGYLCSSQAVSTYLSYNSTTTLNFAFPNLEIGKSYFVIFFYYSNGEQERIKATSSRTIVSPYNVCDVNQDGAVTSADVTAIYDVLLGVSNRFRGYSDINGDGYVTSADITAIYNHLLGN